MALKTTVKISGGKKVQPLTVEKIEVLAGFVFLFHFDILASIYPSPFKVVFDMDK